MFCSVMVRISSVEVQRGRVRAWHVLKPVLKSAGEPDAVGEALATQGVSSLGDFVLSFNTFLLDAYSGMVCIVSPNYEYCSRFHFSCLFYLLLKGGVKGGFQSAVNNDVANSCVIPASSCLE